MVQILFKIRKDDQHYHESELLQPEGWRFLRFLRTRTITVQETLILPLTLCRNQPNPRAVDSAFTAG